jgi:hypothetical protein
MDLFCEKGTLLLQDHNYFYKIKVPVSIRMKFMMHAWMAVKKYTPSSQLREALLEKIIMTFSCTNNSKA